MRKLLSFFLVVLCWSCNENTNTEKHQNNRNNVINVKDKLVQFNAEETFISSLSSLSITDDYLIIIDHKTVDYYIHIFDKKNFTYLASAIPKGQGPGEITVIGHIEANNADRELYVSDHGKLKIFSYKIDSLITNPLYMPEVKMSMDLVLFPDEYLYINDTLSIGKVIEPIGVSDFKPYVAKWNMSTGVFVPMKYEHPGIPKKRISFAISMEDSIYVECYLYHDLMTICDINGNLKYNVYGPNWDSLNSNCYFNVLFCKKNIFASYYEKDNAKNSPSKILIFNTDGDYIKTLDIGYKIIQNFCYDRDNNRILLCLDSEIQFAYLSLDDLL